jgi:hypothetical protein
MRNRLFAIVTVILLLGILYVLLFHATNVRSGKSFSADTSRTSKQSNSEDVVTARRNDTKNGKRGDSKDPNLQLTKISKATANIVRALEEDEANRTVLLEEKERDDCYTYLLQIQSRQDIDKFIAQLCNEYSKAHDINELALKTAVQDSVDDFRIPSGFVQQVFIKVAKSENVPTYFTMMPIAGNTEVKAQNFTTTSGSVKPGQTDWRYEKILELTSEKLNNE